MIETAIPIHAKSTLELNLDKKPSPSPNKDAQTSYSLVGEHSHLASPKGRESSKRTLVPFLSTFYETPAPVKHHFFERGELIPLENSMLWRIERGIVCASTWDEDGKSTTLEDV